MDNEFDNFYDAIDGIEVERKKEKFKLNQLKIEHFYWDHDEIESDMPISTSIELVSEYNFENETLEWKKIISHTYLDSNEDSGKKVDSTIEEIEDVDTLINKLEEIDLRDLKNNYYTEDIEDNSNHWEITYNNFFKIVGTYDQEIHAFKRIKELLNLKDIINAIKEN